VEVVRGLYEADAQADTAGALALLDPEIEAEYRDDPTARAGLPRVVVQRRACEVKYRTSSVTTTSAPTITAATRTPIAAMTRSAPPSTCRMDGSLDVPADGSRSATLGKLVDVVPS
jgi:hypothetical protein